MVSWNRRVHLLDFAVFTFIVKDVRMELWRFTVSKEKTLTNNFNSNFNLSEHCTVYCKCYPVVFISNRNVNYNKRKEHVTL